MSNVISVETHEKDEDDFKYYPCYQTSELGMITIIRHFLESNRIPFVIIGEDLIFLSGAAIPFEEAVATVHLMKKDIPLLMDFIRNPY
ncbi:MAG: hypothetical protein H7A23_14330 [Leptospiraceae bacterium]|nr:hypothetical protein [Leptospiraceae bacterium]MCP5495728.1 hypothetical protein [Leptospiraceae bacterium]